MENIVIFVLGLFLGAVVCSLAKVSGNNELINEKMQLEEENKELRYDNEELRRAESRATAYARLIKEIEDIVFGKGTIVDKHDAIVKILKGEK